MFFQDGWREDQVHGELMNLYAIKIELAYIEHLKPQFFKEGNQWCYILGEMPVHYVAGFGDTPQQAASNFVKAYRTETITHHKK